MDMEYPEDATLLWTYYRSSCSWRVRLALQLKNIQYTPICVNLLNNDQQSDLNLVNPSQLVPSLRINGVTLNQSLAIIEYLEEAYPNEHQLLGEDPSTRAIIRSLAFILACDTQPLQNLRVLRFFSQEQAQRTDWAKHWIQLGLQAYEKAVAPHMGRFSVGDQVTMADLALVPQVYNAGRFNVNMATFPNIVRIHSNLISLDAFKLAHPDAQPDCPSKI